MFEELIGVDLAAAIRSASAGGATSPAETEHSLAELVDRVTACDRLMSWTTAMQARAVAALVAGFEKAHLAGPQAGATADDEAATRLDAAKDCAVELGMARATGIRAARTLIGFADALVADHPVLLTALEQGRVSTWIARAMLSETEVLPSRLRCEADAQICPLLPGMSWGEASQTARRVVLELDPVAADRRAIAARKGRSMSVRPGPDGMAGLSANLPAEQAVACWESLDSQARGLKADGDPRTLMQLMCDTLVERLTGIASVDRLPVRVGVAVCASTLVGGDKHPAMLRGYGSIPASILTKLIGGPDTTLRRLVTDPVDDHVLAVDSKQRLFRGQLCELILTVDPVCVAPAVTAPLSRLTTPRGTPTAVPQQRATGSACANAITLPVNSPATGSTSSTVTVRVIPGIVPRSGGSP